MKTIFDKVDPRYIDCATGVCEHTNHAPNLMYMAILTGALLFVLTRNLLKLRDHLFS